MSKIKRMKYGFFGILAISTIGLSSAYAIEELPIPKDSYLGQVFDQWQQQLNFLNSYISSTFSRNLEPLGQFLGVDLQAAIDEAVGALGLPDFTKAREEVEQILTGSNSAVNAAERATNEVDRQITRALANATLGKEGQQNTQRQVKTTQSSVAQVYVDATAAQGDVVTQNVMKRIAQQNAQTAAILGAMRTDGLKLQQSQNVANLNLTNISRSLDGQNQARQKETVDQGFSNLKTAAQARLF